MRKLSLEKAIELYDEGFITLEGVYDTCETDLDFYNFLSIHVGMEWDEIEKTMGRDAYYNALDLAELEKLEN